MFNGKKFGIEVCYFQKDIHSLAKKEKKKKNAEKTNMSTDCVFRQIRNITCTLKFVHSKLPVYGRDPFGIPRVIGAIISLGFHPLPDDKF